MPIITEVLLNTAGLEKNSQYSNLSKVEISKLTVQNKHWPKYCIKETGLEDTCDLAARKDKYLFLWVFGYIFFFSPGGVNSVQTTEEFPVKLILLIYKDPHSPVSASLLMAQIRDLKRHQLYQETCTSLLALHCLKYWLNCQL